jgi:hypothetical protein
MDPPGDDSAGKEKQNDHDPARGVFPETVD